MHTECVVSVCFMKWEDLSTLLPQPSYLGSPVQSQYVRMSQNLSFEGTKSCLRAIVGRLASSKFIFKQRKGTLPRSLQWLVPWVLFFLSRLKISRRDLYWLVASENGLAVSRPTPGNLVWVVGRRRAALSLPLWFTPRLRAGAVEQDVSGSSSGFAGTC